MALSIRRIEGPVAFALALAHNKLLAGTVVVGSSFHADITSTTSGDLLFTAASASLQITASNAADLPTAITLANQIATILQIHWKDGISTNAYSAGAHKIPDTTNSTAFITAVDLATSITLANAIKAQTNAHFTQAGVHFTNDGTNTIATANATVLADLITLLNAEKTAINAHIIAAPAGSVMLNLISP